MFNFFLGGNMPDFSMCIDDGCPRRETCKRHPASGTIPDRYQSWAALWGKDNKGKCAGYIEVFNANRKEV